MPELTPPTPEQLAAAEALRKERVKARLAAAGGLPIHEPVATGIPPRPKDLGPPADPTKPALLP